MSVMLPEKMKAVVLTEPTKAVEVRLTDCPVPQVRPGWVLVKVRAFGMNHSEQILRRNEIRADYIQKPLIPGIECVGEIADPSDSSFQKGQRVAALMGGMGRSFNGSYAEYALLPAHHVFAVSSDLSWEKLAAVPETYFTAWGSLFEGLRLRPEDTLLVRGATCALGYAAIQLAKALGCRVIATTHKESRLPLLAEADEAVLDTGRLAETLPGAALSDTALSGAAIPGKDLSGKALSGKDLSGKNLSGKNLSGKILSCAARPGVIRSGITKALELVGPKTLSDTLRCVEKGGIVCNTGILGGVYALNGFDPIKDIPNGVYLTGFYSNGPTQEIMDEIFSFLTVHRLQPCVGKCFDFSEIREACKAQDTGVVNGKIVVHISRISDHG